MTDDRYRDNYRDNYRDKQDPYFHSEPDSRPDDKDPRRDQRDDPYRSPDEHSSRPDTDQRYSDDRRRQRDYPPQTNRSTHSTDPRYRPAPSRGPTDGSRQTHKPELRPVHGRGRDSYRGDNDRPPAGEVTYPVKFHGKTSEYFKIWIVNVFLTIITLYIYSAWAKVRTKRYFYGNTSIDGSTFEYHATGKQLVIGRLIAAVLVITYTVFQGINATLSLAALAVIVVMFPWAMWRSLKFNARASSFRNIRFGFDGNAAPPYFNLFLVPILFLALLAAASYFLNSQLDIINLDNLSAPSPDNIRIIGGTLLLVIFIAVVLIIPLLHKNLIWYSHNNHRYGTAKFKAGIKTGRVYGIHLVTFLLSLLALALVAAIMFGAFRLMASPALQDNGIFDRIEPHMQTIAAIGTYLVLIPASGIAVAYFRSAIRNHRYNATSIGSGVRFLSTTGTWSLWWLNLSNLFLLIITLGFAYPFTKIRTARYFAKHTLVKVSGGLDSFTENERSKLNAMGEEMADAFDVEFDIAI